MNAGTWVARRRAGSLDTVGERSESGPRFTRFAAAMEAEPPPSEQVLPDEEGAEVEAVKPPIAPRPRPVLANIQADVPAPQQVESPDDSEAETRIVPPPPASTGTTETEAPASPAMALRRPVAANATRRSDVPWLGIASWLLLCGALFVSLVGWPDQNPFERVAALWSGQAPAVALVDETSQFDPAPGDAADEAADDQAWSTVSPAAGPDESSLPPVELAPPIEIPTWERVFERLPGGPPVPRFKPSVDSVAASFSNAFYEFGDQLQRAGDLDAAVHMRRQGSNLNPWKSSGSSDL
ncbi:MAG: hypothetical protein AAF637_02200 [Pseudomonadota bacterium]